MRPIVLALALALLALTPQAQADDPPAELVQTAKALRIKLAVLEATARKIESGTVREHFLKLCAAAQSPLGALIREPQRRAAHCEQLIEYLEVLRSGKSHTVASVANAGLRAELTRQLDKLLTAAGAAKAPAPAPTPDPIASQLVSLKKLVAVMQRDSARIADGITREHFRKLLAATTDQMRQLEGTLAKRRVRTELRLVSLEDRFAKQAAQLEQLAAQNKALMQELAALREQLKRR